ncbi:hypothetical protein [Nocardia niigatensis]|uniref:hypothetical protein n=1 Tax=Nocardia niigatensis TaxID=209249 RepID=UPI0012F6E7C2|nr:hypothetical protein [Nocardia niigatensis]
MTIFFVVVVGFFVLLFGYAMVTAVVHRDPRPRSRRSGSFDDFGISSDTSHSGIPPEHGGHPDSGGHHSGGSID